MNHARRESGISEEALSALQRRETESFRRRNPNSARLATASAEHWLNGVPMHWMRDWGTPHAFFARRARGADVEDVDGNTYADFCLGDTGAMFGHSPRPIERVMREHAERGITAMLPAERVASVGQKLTDVFGLPFWQMTQTATDANRAALRWARAITQRPRTLVFDGCYHGTVDETLVRLVDGVTRPRRGLIGAHPGASACTDAVPFNDVASLEGVLARRETAAVIAEPAMTNAGMILPEPGFLTTLRELTRRHGTLLIIDETHTLSTARGGYTRAHGLEPDLWVCGKAIAGGMPCAVFGFTAEIEAGMRRVLVARDGGHSGMGTTLSANALAVDCLEASLDELQTEANYSHMIETAGRLTAKFAALRESRGLSWSVTAMGARVEIGFARERPRNAVEAEHGFWPELEHAMHLYLLNRGVLLTPFHNMMLCCPETTAAHVDKLIDTLGSCLSDLGLRA